MQYDLFQKNPFIVEINMCPRFIAATLAVSRTFLLLIPVSLFGCAAVGPEYLPPAIETPVKWEAALPHGGQQAVLKDWWSQFDDPVLTGLIVDAQATSPTLAIAAARIAEARAALTVSQSATLPALNGTTAVNTGNASKSGIPASTHSVVASVAVDALWELDLFGSVRRSTEAAAARLSARQFEWHEARISLAAEVANVYVGYRACRQLEAAFARDAVSRGEAQRLIRLLAETGFSARADMELADASLSDARSELENQRATCEIAVKSMVTLIGLPEIPLRARLNDGDATAPARLPVPSAFTVEAVPLRALSQRPDLAAAERGLAAASADVGLAEANRYPRLTLSGSISLVNIIGGTGAGMSSQPWSIIPAMSVPLFDADKRAAGVKIAEARLAQQRAAYEAAVRSAVNEVEQALVNLDSTRRREADAQAAAAGYANYFNAAETNWRAGGVSLLSLEDARRNANLAERKLIALQRLRVQSWISLYKALGGGWQAGAGDIS